MTAFTRLPGRARPERAGLMRVRTDGACGRTLPTGTRTGADGSIGAPPARRLVRRSIALRFLVIVIAIAAARRAAERPGPTRPDRPRADTAPRGRVTEPRGGRRGLGRRDGVGTAGAGSEKPDRRGAAGAGSIEEGLCVCDGIGSFSLDIGFSRVKAARNGARRCWRRCRATTD